MNERAERTAVFVFGVVFVATLLVLALLVPRPTAFQYTVFRIVLALAAAGVAAFIPGSLHLEMRGWLRAGGAVAIFAIVYFFSPAGLVAEPPVPEVGSELDLQTESVAVLDGSMKVFFTAWNRHPTAKLRIRDFGLVELDRIPTELYCCPEERSELILHLSTRQVAEPSLPPLPDNKAQAAVLPSTTFEILPLSSHSFVATVEVERGMADNDPIVWYGLEAYYSTPGAAELLGRSDRIYIANAQDEPSLSYRRSELENLLASGSFLGRETSPNVRRWFESLKPEVESRR